MTSLHFRFLICERDNSPTLQGCCKNIALKYIMWLAYCLQKSLAWWKLWLWPLLLVSDPTGQMKALCCSFHYFSGSPDFSPFLITQPLFFLPHPTPREQPGSSQKGPHNLGDISMCQDMYKNPGMNTAPHSGPHQFYPGQNPITSLRRGQNAHKILR